MQRAGYVLMGIAVTSVVLGCGGGGNSANSQDVRVDIDATSITAVATPADVGLVRTLLLTLRGGPQNVYVGVVSTNNGVENANFVPTSATTAQLQIAFKPGVGLADGTYTDTVEVVVCYDVKCDRPVAGSPLRVTTSYTVSSAASVSIDNASIAISAPSSSSSRASRSLMIAVADLPPDSPLYILPTYSTNGISSVSASRLSNATASVNVDFGTPSQKTPGTYTDSVTVRVCYDQACTRAVRGGPFTVSTTLTIQSDAQPEPGVAALVVASRLALSHDVIDAEFSKALNAVVMVSAWPKNALYVYDVASGTEKQVILNKPPKAVSVSPDGLRAAVGHDALVSHVDLATAGDLGAPSPLLLNVTADVGDLVLDGRGYVHVYPASDQWVSVHSIAVASNTETLGYGPYAGARARLHPSGDSMYSANNGLSPDDIERYDISSGTAALQGDSPYHGDYPMCGNLWFNEDGATIYTACGKAFRASTVRSLDMVYAGSMPLSPGTLYGYRILSLSQSAKAKQIVLIEQPWYECQPFVNNANGCVSHLSFYESDFLNRTAVYSIPPVTLAGASYPQRGMFVFHAGGGSKVLISRLHGMSNPLAQYQLSVVP